MTSSGCRDLIVAVPLVDLLVDESDPLRALVLTESRVHVVSAVAATVLQEAAAPGIDSEMLRRVVGQLFGAPVPRSIDDEGPHESEDAAVARALDAVIAELRIAGLLRPLG